LLSRSVFLSFTTIALVLSIKKKFRVHRRHPKQAKTTTKTTHRVGGEKKWEVVVEISFALLIPLAILLT